MVRSLHALCFLAVLVLAAPTFSAEERHIVVGDCMVNGCSNEFCSDSKSLATAGASPCIMKPEFACYPSMGECKRQADGNCGWTQTPALTACLAHPPKEPGTTPPAPPPGPPLAQHAPAPASLKQ